MINYVAKKPNAAGLVEFDKVENKTWQLLYERQCDVIQNRACDEYLHGLKKLDMPAHRIPQCGEINEVLMASTGWSVVPVDAIIPLNKFFMLLANKQFPAATFIRVREELDYLKEPDIFHEYFGHCPMLTNSAYADFIQWYGEQAINTTKQTQAILGRLFWFTIEFGLVQTANGLRIYGGGILSSFTETVYALESEHPSRCPFLLEQVLNTSYHYDEIQKKYFILSNVDELFKLRKVQLIALADQIRNTPDKSFNIC
jgi:phenylalanine-4-hydroxylase